MAAGDWLPLGTTALGGVLAVGGGAVVQWAGSRRTHRDALAERRRVAYVEFLAAANEFARILATALEAHTAYGRAADAIGAVERAQAMVVLAGPDEAVRASAGVRLKVWELMNLLERPSAPTHDVVELVNRSYWATVDQFVKVARQVVSSSG